MTRPANQLSLKWLARSHVERFLSRAASWRHSHLIHGEDIDMLLQDILSTKGGAVFSIEPGKRLSDVVQVLMEHRCGSLMVLDGSDGGHEPRIAGIITERDILRACAERRGSLDELKVSDYMSSRLVTGTPADSVEEIMGVMTDNRIRHLPVVDGGRLLGLISIGDLVKSHLHQTQVENHQLKTYIQS